MNDFDPVINFISRFTDHGKRLEVIETFTHGCCYWFAGILYERFKYEDYGDDTKIMYAPKDNHWGCRINGAVYDITGDVSDTYDWEYWLEYAVKDTAHTKRLYRDCIAWEEDNYDY